MLVWWVRWPSVLVGGGFRAGIGKIGQEENSIKFGFLLSLIDDTGNGRIDLIKLLADKKV